MMSSMLGHPQQSSVAPELFHLIERGEWKQVVERCRTHPKEARVWVNLKKTSVLTSAVSSGYETSGTAVDDNNMDYTVGNDSSANRSIGTVTSSKSNGSASSAAARVVKCQALHHACQRLRSVHGRIQKTLAYMDDSLSDTPPMSPSDILRARARTASSDIDVMRLIQTSPTQYMDVPPLHHEDPWIEACKAILVLIEAHPGAVEMRESRHGCLPLHLAVFSMCPTPLPSPSILSRQTTGFTSHNSQPPSTLPTATTTPTSKPSAPLLPRRKKGKSLDLSSHQSTTSPSPSLSTTTSLLDRVGRRTKSMSCVTMYPDSPSGPNHETLHDLAETSLQPTPLRRYVSDPIDERGHLHYTVESTEEPTHAFDNNLPTIDKPFLFTISSNSTKEGGSSVASMSSSSFNNHNMPTSPLQFNTHTTTSYLRSRSNSLSTTNHIHSSTNLTEQILPNFYISQYMTDAQLREEFSIQVLNALLQAYPKGVKIDSEGSRLPLHTAVAGRAILPVIRRLLAAYPDAARHRNKEGYLPLHLAAHWGVSSPLVAPLLLMAYPDACLGKNRWERTPLEEALAIAGENGRMHQIPLVRALRRHPSYWTRALHQKIQGGNSSLGELEHLEKLFDDLFQDDEGRYNNQEYSMQENQPGSSDVTRQQDSATQDSATHLVEEEEKKVSYHSPSSQGFDSPLDDQSSLDLLIKKRSWKKLLARIQKDPTDVSILRKIPVRAGYTARASLLYLACERNPPLNVIQALVALCPVATVTRKDPGGQLPLHAACTWGATFDVFSFLLGIHPLASTQMDDLGNLPLHCACFSGCSDEVIDALLQAFPRSVMTRNVHGSVPSDIVRRLRHVNKRSILALIEKIELDILLRPRSMSHEMDIVIVQKAHTASSEHDHETLSDVGMKDSEPMIFVEDDEILKGVDEEIDEDGRLWV